MITADSTTRTAIFRRPCSGTRGYLTAETEALKDA